MQLKKLRKKKEEAEFNQEVLIYNMKKQIREMEDKVLS